MAPIVTKFPEKVNDHIYFNNNTCLAITQGKNIEIYKISSGTSKTLIHTLKGHDEPITAIDISPQGFIASASQDRNAIVWKPKDGSYTEYEKQLVFLRINRAATSIKWSPSGTKFAVGSGSKSVCICHQDQASDWWSSRQIKKQLTSTILSVAWHPNGVLIACGGTDNKCHVISAYIKGVDEKPGASVWGSKFPFGTICGAFSSMPGGWVHDVAFSPSGNLVGFVSNDATVTIVYPSEGSFVPVCANSNYGSFQTIEFVDENSVIVAGQNCFPVIYQGSPEGWAEGHSLDPTTGAAKPKPKPKVFGVNDDEEENSTGGSALDMFRQLDLKGKVQNKGVSDLPTIHQNTITSLRFYDGSHISTSGVDGKVVIFPI